MIHNETFVYLIAGMTKKNSGQVSLFHAVAGTRETAVNILIADAIRNLHIFDDSNKPCFTNSNINTNNIKKCIAGKVNTIASTAKTPLGDLDTRFALEVKDAPEDVHTMKLRIWEKGKANTNSYEIRIIKLPVIGDT